MDVETTDFLVDLTDINRTKTRLSRCSSSKGHVLVSVADNGAGLPAGFDLAGKKGLGLKVVHTLATRQLHGKLAYFSGRGSRFAFEFDESAA